MDNRNPKSDSHDDHDVDPGEARTDAPRQVVGDAADHGLQKDNSAADAHTTTHETSTDHADVDGGDGGREAHADAHADDEHTGHGAQVDHSGHEQMFRRKFWVSLLLSIPVLLYSPTLQGWLGFTMPLFPGSQWITPTFAVIVFAYGGLPFLQMAVPEIKNGQPGMMTLISLAITVAFVYSMTALFLPGGATFFWELVTLIDIMLLGHWIEMRSVRQASGALNELAKLMPDTAERVDENGDIEEVASSELHDGDFVLVRPGSSIPADGEVISGDSDVDEAMITGESKPVTKGEEDKVIAGAINGDGSLRVRVTATGDETALAGIMRLVDDAQQSKSKTQILADRAAGWLFYVALGAAIITAIAWTVAVGFNAEVVARVATVLVIACPHALGLAVPLVVAISTSRAASNGILVRDRLALEQSREVDIVIFDKTGTLTRGEFGIVDIATTEGWDDADALALTAAIEGDSEHTIARGVRRSAEERELDLPDDVRDFEAIKGRGVRAEHGDHTYYVGGPRMIEMLEISVPETLADFDEDTSAKGQSTVYLIEAEGDNTNETGNESGAQVVVGFALADVIRPESREAVQKLHDMGMEVAMLTGDAEAVARTVAEELGIDQFFAEVLPENKDEKVRELQEQDKRVAMVGDGINDAPALTRADVGIAIGSGTDVAVESAGIILVRSNPLDIVKIVGLSRASNRKMIQNLWWAAGYNIVALPLAAGILAPIGILLSPAVGAVLMSLSTVIVAINAQLLRQADLGA